MNGLFFTITNVTFSSCCIVQYWLFAWVCYKILPVTYSHKQPTWKFEFKNAPSVFISPLFFFSLLLSKSSTVFLFVQQLFRWSFRNQLSGSVSILPEDNDFSLLKCFGVYYSKIFMKVYWCPFMKQKYFISALQGDNLLDKHVSQGSFLLHFL